MMQQFNRASVKIVWIINWGGDCIKRRLQRIVQETWPYIVKDVRS